MESQEKNLETGEAKLLTRPDVNVADLSKTKSSKGKESISVSHQPRYG